MLLVVEGALYRNQVVEVRHPEVERIVGKIVNEKEMVVAVAV